MSDVTRAVTADPTGSGTPFVTRTAPLNKNALWMHWGEMTVVDVYDDPIAELRAIRENVAVGDMSPLSKYRLSGPQAEAYLDYMITRDMTVVQPGQAIYAPWCNEQGKTVSGSVIMRDDETTFRLAVDPIMHWLERHAEGFEVQIEEITDQVGILTLQGPKSPDVLEAATGMDWREMAFSRLRAAEVGGCQVDVMRQGFTGEIGYELWVDAPDGPAVWDAVAEAGAPFAMVPAGALALDIARIEAGLIIDGYDYSTGGADSYGARIKPSPAFQATPAELGNGQFVDFEKSDFLGKAALAANPGTRSIVGLDCDWKTLLEAHIQRGIAPLGLGRVHWYPKTLTHNGESIGRATSITWSPTLGTLIGFGHLEPDYAQPGITVSISWEIAGDQVAIPAKVCTLPMVQRRRRTTLTA